MTITGKNIIGGRLSGLGEATLRAMDAREQVELEGYFHPATDEEIAEAVADAKRSFPLLRTIEGTYRAKFLREIADQIFELGDELIERAMKESGLPEARIRGERGRTVGQLRQFADLVEEGSWVDATIDTAIPERSPAPKPDLRKMLIAVGPVVVFTASNFPLAFSTAGGDTAAAIAAGNPVIVKAHESHLGTNELVSKAILTAAEKLNMPTGAFASLNGDGYDLGHKLVVHPDVKSVAFTGSQSGGMALHKLAQTRKEPIPVFAEMGSINPIVILPGGLKNPTALAESIAGSVTLGSGQFCTNPGLILLQTESPDEFISALSKAVENVQSQTMLNKGIFENYKKGVDELVGQNSVEVTGRSTSADEQKLESNSVVLSVPGKEVLRNPALRREVFGPSTLVVHCSDMDELEKVIQSLEGQLTATVYADVDETVDNPELMRILRDKVGRVIYQGLPTGVEVCPAMHHGGPFPASTDGRFSSVGTDSIKRFARPVSYQNWPQEALPQELRDGNPMSLWRRVDGQYGRH